MIADIDLLYESPFGWIYNFKCRNEEEGISGLEFRF
jgi:hypothetical protein